MTEILAFLSLEDFAREVSPVDLKVRVESITRTLESKTMPSGLIQWIVIVTARISEGIAMTSIKTGETWKIFVKDESYHSDNAECALAVIKRYLKGQGFPVSPGVWEPNTVMDNIVGGICDLWHFDEDKRLVPNEQLEEVYEGD